MGYTDSWASCVYRTKDMTIWCKRKVTKQKLEAGFDGGELIKKRKASLSHFLSACLLCLSTFFLSCYVNGLIAF
jgi:hypothetical protein